MGMNIKSLTRTLLAVLPFVATAMMVTSCVTETDDEWDPYYNWAARNAVWYKEVADSARTAIAQAKALHGDAWEEHCDWRMYRSLQRSEMVGGPVTDSVCVHIRERGMGAESPLYTDSVDLCYRGWIMATEYEGPNGTYVSGRKIFSETYSGVYNPLTAKPVRMVVKQTVEGFSTALQYMVEGDVWDVYIPQNLAYGEKGSTAIPAYSTLLFRIHLR